MFAGCTKHDAQLINESKAQPKNAATSKLVLVP
jgi:hypothetical protein